MGDFDWGPMLSAFSVGLALGGWLGVRREQKYQGVVLEGEMDERYDEGYEAGFQEGRAPHGSSRFAAPTPSDAGEVGR